MAQAASSSLLLLPLEILALQVLPDRSLTLPVRLSPAVSLWSRAARGRWGWEQDTSVMVQAALSFFPREILALPVHAVQ